MSSAPQDAAEIYPAASGHPTARLRCAGQWQAIHSAFAPELEGNEAGWPALWAPIVVALGTGLGYHLHNLSRRYPGERTWILLEEDPALRAHCRALLGLPGSLFFLDGQSPPSPELLRHLWACWDTRVQILPHPARERQSKGSLRAWWSAHLLPAWNKLRPVSPLGAPAPPRPRQLWMPAKAHFLSRELQNAAAELEWTFANPIGPTAPVATTSSLCLLDEIWRSWTQSPPDLALWVNLKGMDEGGQLAEMAQQLQISQAVWFVDDPRPILAAFPADLAPRLCAFCWEKAYLPYLRGAGFAAVHWLPLAGDPHSFLRDPPASPVIPLAFAGSAMAGAFLSNIRRRFLYRPELEPWVQARAGELLAGTTRAHQLPDSADSAVPFSDLRNRAWLASLAIHTASAQRRRDFLTPLQDLGLVLAGDPDGWRNLLGSKAQVRPDLDYYRELPTFYGSAALQVNITSCQMPSAVNQRVFDVPLAGGCLLTDAQADLGELLDLRDCTTFSSPEELREKARSLLGNPREAREKSLRAQRAILSQHTYTHRLRQILDTF